MGILVPSFEAGGNKKLTAEEISAKAEAKRLKDLVITQEVGGIAANVFSKFAIVAAWIASMPTERATMFNEDTSIAFIMTGVVAVGAVVAMRRSEAARIELETGVAPGAVDAAEVIRGQT